MESYSQKKVFFLKKVLEFAIIRIFLWKRIIKKKPEEKEINSIKNRMNKL